MDVALEEGEVLRDFDYSVRVNLANSSLCGDRQRSVALKLRLAKPDGSERQVRRMTLPQIAQKDISLSRSLCCLCR